MSKNKWVYSTNDEEWTSELEFETKEQAIEAGKKDIDCIEIGYFYVGEAVPIDEEFLLNRINLFDIENFNETIDEQIDGDEDYAPEKENSVKVDELNKLIADFIIKNFIRTINFVIEEIEKIKLC